MADERVGSREFDVRKNLSWTELFRTFLIALDPFKLLVAAVGILATAIGWWLISMVFYGAWSEPTKEQFETRSSEATRFIKMTDLAGPNGHFRTMPWFEERGRNPFLVLSGAVGAGEPAGIRSYFLSQVPVTVEPLVKFLSPILLLFDPAANFWMKCYGFLLIIWMLLVWAFFGGIITRMAIVQMAGKEGGGLRDAVRFVRARYLSYLFSPIVPILLIFAVVLGCILFGLFHLIPGFGAIVVDGLFWWIPLGAGFVMALLVVGLIGFPLMYTTLSAEGSDTFDALSRSYNYVYESPWNYLWYGFLAVVYGIVCVFFVVFMSSLTVYLGKWGVSQTPLTQSADSSPEYLFIYSPTSFGWRELMLEGSPAAVTRNANYSRPLPDEPSKQDLRMYAPRNPEEHKKYMDSYWWFHYVGAGMVGFWMTLFFMLMLGFSYSYFWTAASMIYLLMRKKVDEVEVDEIFTDDEDFDEPVAPPKPSAPSAAEGPKPIPIDAPTLRVSTPPPAPEEKLPPPESPPPSNP